MDAITGRSAAKRRVYHQRRIANASNDRAQKTQSMAWLYAELAQFNDATAAKVVQAFAAQLNAGAIPPLDEETTP